jgi:hypothetical protein
MFMAKLLRRIAMAEKAGADVIAAIEEEALSIHNKFLGNDYERVSAFSCPWQTSHLQC